MNRELKKKLSKIIIAVEGIPLLGKLVRKSRYPLQRLIYRRSAVENSEVWKKRIKYAVDAPDNKDIPRVADAGQLKCGILTMHNGIRIHAGSYHGEKMRVLLSANKGVHEPQEEKIFQEVLKAMPEGATMLELGAYWAFYSAWFHSVVPKAQCYLCEPKKSNLKYGEENFKLNGFRGTFIEGYSGENESVAPDGVRIRTVDNIISEYSIERLNVLHSDIQGFEYEMLKGAERSLSEKRIDYVFISTHSNELHEQCRSLLVEKHGYSVLASANLDESYSIDGILVVKKPDSDGPRTVAISRRN